MRVNLNPHLSSNPIHLRLSLRTTRERLLRPGLPFPGSEPRVPTTFVSVPYDIHHTIDSGVTFPDTSNVYGPFTNDILIGKELAAAEDLKLKERLTKIHRKRSVNEQLSSRDNRAWERLDLEFLKRDIRKDDISLEDQLRQVKSKKAEVLTNDNYAP
ncbi:hypothetical protein L2E82_21235 [Cichorium intybus]|uniref:Uncharacterized protein n=1 Tax=Cichorium intybus TaxID=13427 RepID=A0ACB9DVH6_CICIN|nr:hypothetical protein L2E82_21235 [Cichorium intybus]